MSDTKRVARDTKHAELTMSIEAVHEAKGWLEWLTQREHRGRHDTWTAARGRAAKKAGVPESYAKRLWDRWEEMKDVSGGTYRALHRAYQSQCDRQEETAAHYRKLREAMTDGGPSNTDGDRRSMGVASVPPHASAPTARPLP
jgi:hypothetical protein